MLRLETFGGLALVDGAGAAVAIQHRRLALLALLAAAGERGLTRDKLLAYLWPERPVPNARHALEQLLYAAPAAAVSALLGRLLYQTGERELERTPQPARDEIRREL